MESVRSRELGENEASGADRERFVASVRDCLVQSFSKAVSMTSMVVHANFPHYGNVGDSAIWLAEEALLQSNGEAAPVTLPTFDAAVRFFRKHEPDSTTIILPGGGNFGSLWPGEHERRLRLMEQFDKATFIQMPQSIYFVDDDLLARTRSVLKKVRNFTLFVRDRASVDFARRYLDCEAHLVPDAAVFLNLETQATPGREVVHIIRGDKEGRAVDLHTNLDRLWTEDSRAVRRISKYARWAGTISPGTAVESSLYRKVARERVRKGIELLASARGVITDRLHGHILCALLGVPHVSVDTVQGKIRNFRETWTSEVPYCTVVDDIAHAGTALDDILTGHG